MEGHTSIPSHHVVHSHVEGGEGPFDLIAGFVEGAIADSRMWMWNMR